MGVMTIMGMYFIPKTVPGYAVGGGDDQGGFDKRVIAYFYHREGVFRAAGGEDGMAVKALPARVYI